MLKKFIKWPSTTVMDKFAEEFQNLHHISYVVGAVDGSHMPIIAPWLHAADYNNRKGFYSILLQGVDSSKCLGFRHRLGGVYTRCQFVEEDRDWSILRGMEYLAICSNRGCCIPVSPVDARTVQGTQRWVVPSGISLELRSKFNAHVHRMNVRHAQGRWAYSSGGLVC